MVRKKNWMNRTIATGKYLDSSAVAPFGGIKDPVVLVLPSRKASSSSPPKQYWSLAALLRSGVHPYDPRTPLTMDDIDPVVSPQLLKADFLETMRKLGQHGWGGLTRVWHDMHQLPEAHPARPTHFLRQSDWGEVAGAFEDGYRTFLGDK